MAAHAAARGDAAALLSLLAESPEMAHERDEKGDTPLHAAAEGSEASAVAALLAAGAEADARNNNGETPLLCHVKRSSCAPDDTHVLDLLLAHGADVNATDISGVSPLTEVVYEGKSPLLARMLQPDANADLGATRDGQSLLAMARTPADRRLLHGHPASPVSRLSSAFASASRRARNLERGPALESLLVRTAALAAPDGRGVVGAAMLGEPGPLQAATCRLEPGSVAAAFAQDEPPLPQADEPAAAGLDAAFARVALGDDDAAAARPAPAEVVERRVLRQLLPTPPSAWKPQQPGEPAFCLPAADVLELYTRAHSLFTLERCARRAPRPHMAPRWVGCCCVRLNSHAGARVSPRRCSGQHGAAPAGAGQDLRRHARAVQGPDAPVRRLWGAVSGGRPVRHRLSVPGRLRGPRQAPAGNRVPGPGSQGAVIK